MAKWTGPREWADTDTRQWRPGTYEIDPANGTLAHSCTAPGCEGIVDLEGIASANHAQTAGVPTLAQQYVLTVANASQAQSAGVPALHFKLAPANATHAHSAQALSFTTEDVTPRTWKGDRTWADTDTRDWVPGLPDAYAADVSHAHSAGAATLTQHHELVTVSANHAQTAQATLAQAIATLALVNSTLAHSAGASTVTVGHVLAVVSGSHAQTAGAVTLGDFVRPASASHTHTAQAATLTAIGQVTNNANASNAHTVSDVRLIEGHVFQLNNADHAHSTSQPTLAEIEASSLLALANAAHGQTAGVPTLTILHVLFTANINHALASSVPRAQSSEFKILGPIRRPSIHKAYSGRGIAATGRKSISAG